MGQYVEWNFLPLAPLYGFSAEDAWIPVEVLCIALQLKSYYDKENK